MFTTPHVQFVEHAKLSATPARVEAWFEELCAPLADLSDVSDFPRHTCFMLRRACIRALLESVVQV